MKNKCIRKSGTDHTSSKRYVFIRLSRIFSLTFLVMSTLSITLWTSNAMAQPASANSDTGLLFYFSSMDGSNRPSYYCMGSSSDGCPCSGMGHSFNCSNASAALNIKWVGSPELLFNSGSFGGYCSCIIPGRPPGPAVNCSPATKSRIKYFTCVLNIVYQHKAGNVIL